MLAKGESIGQKRIEQFESVEISQLRLIISKAIKTPQIKELSIFYVKPK